MAFTNDDRVLDTTTTTGTGAITLAATPPTGFQSFGQAMSTNDYCHYCIVGGNEWEVGLGQLTSGGSVTNVLARQQVYSSSNNDALVNFSSGSKSVFITQPGNRKGSPVVYIATANAQVANTTTETTLIGSGVGTLELLANSLFIGRTYRVRLRGVLTTQGSPATLNIKVKIGSTVIGQTTAIAPTGSLTNKGWELDFVFTVRTTGASGTVMGQGEFNHSSGTALVSWDLENAAAVTVDTTANHVLNVTATWGAASASDDIRCTNCTVESLN